MNMITFNDLFYFVSTRITKVHAYLHIKRKSFIIKSQICLLTVENRLIFYRYTGHIFGGNQVFPQRLLIQVLLLCVYGILPSVNLWKC